jgi:hypothetical protein
MPKENNVADAKPGSLLGSGPGSTKKQAATQSDNAIPVLLLLNG